MAIVCQVAMPGKLIYPIKGIYFILSMRELTVYIAMGVVFSALSYLQNQDWSQSRQQSGSIDVLFYARHLYTLSLKRFICHISMRIPPNANPKVFSGGFLLTRSWPPRSCAELISISRSNSYTNYNPNQSIRELWRVIRFHALLPVSIIQLQQSICLRLP